jgi:hypothetical protein
MAPADPQAHQIALEMPARQGLDTAVEPIGQRPGHGAAQQGRRLEGHGCGSVRPPDGEGLDPDGLADSAGRIAIL